MSDRYIVIQAKPQRPSDPYDVVDYRQGRVVATLPTLKEAGAWIDLADAQRGGE